MAFSPTEAPVYGGGTIVVAFSESSLLPGNEAELYLVFQGSSARHITLARRLNTHSLQAIVPGHNCFELAQLSVYAFHNGGMELLSDGMFNFVPDSTFFLAQFLAGSVRDVNALDDPASLKTEQFDLWSEDMSTLDERLACAFEHLELPPSWRLVEDSSRLDQDPPPRETLLHFAARLGLSQFAQQLLDKAGSDVALRLPNKNGELASDLARARGLEDLADRMLEHTLSGDGSSQHDDLGRVQTKSVSVKRHSIGTATITTKTGETTRTLEDDIQMLRELVSFMGEDNMENESPISTSRTPLDDSGGSPNYSSPSGSKPGSNRDSKNLDDDDDDDDEDDEENVASRSPKLKVLEQSMQQLQAISESVQRLKDRNKALLSEEASRRESLSRFSASCPVLAEDKKRKKKGKV
ncbi:A-kinase anchor protein 13-like isoform X2 [Amphiura filiformis]